jgi:hypothetical protein
MEKEQWEIERDTITKAFDDHPPQRGIKKDKHRHLRIVKDINNKWTDKRCIYKLEKLIKQPNQHYIKGLLKYNWPIVTTFDIFTKRYFERDIDGVISNNDITDINSIINIFREHYNDNSDCLFYVISFTDDGLPYKYKKAGFSRKFISRRKQVKLLVPFEISNVKTWEIQSDKLIYVEDHIKRFLKPYHKNGEFFRDPNNVLIPLISEELNHLIKEHNIHIKEIL